MEQRFNGEETLGSIVADFPGARHLFKRYKLDFCCGGERSLAVAARRQHVDEGEILRRLNESYAQMQAREQVGVDWRQVPIAALIDHIVDRHHAYLRKELPQLSEFVTKILRVHGGTHAELSALYRRFHQMKLELDQHLIAEEEVLFPMLKQYASNPAADRQERTLSGLHELEADHSLVGDLLKEIRELTDDYALPPDACKTYMLTFRQLVELESDLFEHIHLENNVLFPRIESQQVQ